MTIMMKIGTVKFTGKKSNIQIQFIAIADILFYFELSKLT